jgi:hypothetical protein
MKHVLRWFVRFSILAVALFFVFGCERGLAPEDAQAIIDKSPAFTPAAVTIPVLGPTAQAGVKEGCWTQRYDGAISLTPKGDQIFASCEGHIRGTSIVFYATPEKQIRRKVVEVTSITDAPSSATPGTEKIADFTWQWQLDDLPPDARKCLGLSANPYLGGQGAVLMKQEKDGWHVEKYQDRFGPM